MAKPSCAPRGLAAVCSPTHPTALPAGPPVDEMRRRPGPWAWIHKQRVTQHDADPATAADGAVTAQGIDRSCTGGLYCSDNSPYEASIANSINSKHTKLICSRSLTPKWQNGDLNEACLTQNSLWVPRKATHSHEPLGTRYSAGH